MQEELGLPSVTEEQIAKLQSVVETAREVWGE